MEDKVLVDNFLELIILLGMMISVIGIIKISWTVAKKRNKEKFEREWEAARNESNDI
ncbi:hypothetical protein [Terribacillus sp. DMT04]|uniref:hypothetical protein n=1 Tax=Terribacillus sp. DMT04 TaxID=2850441 RepID=UPI001C2C266B|nr:hypothetical protein [Terribacillus sp. DMT04]QXE03530.1 hypothetical protein KS242_17785 [Terribacillus sp. DMT04]